MSAHDLKDPQGNPASVAGHSPYNSFREECTTMISEVGIARIRAAGEGIRAIVTILKQREDDMDCDGEGLKLSTVTTSGLLSALAVAAEFMEENACEAGPFTQRFDCDEYDHWAVWRTAGAAAKSVKPKRKG